MKGLTSGPNIHCIVAGFNTDAQERSNEEQHQARGNSDVSHHGFWGMCASISQELDLFNAGLAIS